MTAVKVDPAYAAMVPGDASRLTWTAHEATRSPPHLAAATLTVGAAAILIAATEGNVGAGLLAATLLVASLRRFFFPTHYTIDPHGITIRCLGLTTRRPWTRLRRFRYDASGGFLSTRSRPSLLDSFTGLHLTWADNKHEAIPLIEHYLASQTP